MTTAKQEMQRQCRAELDRFFATYPNPALQRSAAKALRFLVASDERLHGKPEAWAAGIIYALANRDRRPCGVPGMLNDEVEQFFVVSISTVRRRAAQVMWALTL